jgi:hypothetical protein
MGSFSLKARACLRPFSGFKERKINVEIMNERAMNINPYRIFPVTEVIPALKVRRRAKRLT